MLGNYQREYIFEVYSEGRETQRFPLAREQWGPSQPSSLFLELVMRLTL